jgi:hypothetical protein
MFRHTVGSFQIHPVLVFLAALAALPVALAQTPAASDLTYDQALLQAATGEQQFLNGYASIGYSPAILTIPDRPFTAHRIYKEWARNGVTGQPIVTTTVTIARDKVGRIHYESSQQPGQVTVMISDPVVHLNYRYNVAADGTASSTADLCTQPQMSQISRPAPAPDPSTASAPAPDTSSPAPAAVAPPVPPSTSQELGVHSMEGTVAYGQRRVDYLSLQPGVKSMQTLAWFSLDLGLNLLEADDYSGQNKFAINTQEIALGDPDPNLFILPTGYTLPGTTQSCIPLLNP